MRRNYFLVSISVLLLSILILVPLSACAEDSAENTNASTIGIDGGDQLRSHAPGTLNETVRIGVLANRGPEIALKEWGPTAEYLSHKLPPNRFEIVPLTFNETMNLSDVQSLSFLISNPSVYTYLEYKSTALCIATLQVPGDPDPQPVFGGVIFTKAGRDDIQSISDLKGKRFSAVDQNSLGGWQAALKELRDAGINPEPDFLP